MAYIQFGLGLMEPIHPFALEEGGHLILPMNESMFLAYLERALGLMVSADRDYLRVEQYRQVLTDYLAGHEGEEVFFRASFEADALATAAKVLAWRDALALMTWDFALVEGLPPRLACLARIEAWLHRSAYHCDLGFAQRFLAVEQALKALSSFEVLEGLWLNEPWDLYPPHWQRLLFRFRQLGLRLVEAKQEAAAELGTCLGYWQRALLRLEGDLPKPSLADGTIRIFRAARERDLALFMAKLLAANTRLQPLCLLSEQTRSLDQALVQEGCPSMGIVSSSLARPTLQLLRLVTAFLWKPIDPYKLLEFVSLPVKPLHHRLSERIAQLLAQKPGLFSAAWEERIADFFADFDRRALEMPERAKDYAAEKEQAEKQYRFWFYRQRQEQNQKVKAVEIAELFDYLRRWSLQLLDQAKQEIDQREKRLRSGKVPLERLAEVQAEIAELLQSQPPLAALHEQARRLVDLLEALPEHQAQLSQLELERLVRSISKPSPLKLQAEEQGHLPFVYESSAVLRPVEHLLWWNFVETQGPIGLLPWYPEEKQFFETQALVYDRAERENQVQLWQRRNAILQTKQELWLCLPKQVQGRKRHAQALWGELEASFSQEVLQAFILDIDQSLASDKPFEDLGQILGPNYQLPDWKNYPTSNFPQPQAYVSIEQGQALRQIRREETYSGLASLLHYPYQWVFKYQIDLNRSTILSVSNSATLMGNLAHRVFQDVLTELQRQPSMLQALKDLEHWLQNYMPQLFEREGAVLLLYGQEPVRVKFQRLIETAVWQLVRAMREGGWQIHGIELPLQGYICDQALKGIADLVLCRGQNEYLIVDLKWTGKTAYQNRLQNKEDLQLVLYARLFAQSIGLETVQTAYYIIDQAKFLTRSPKAFKQAEIINPGEKSYESVHREIWQQMEATYRWRMAELVQGNIEIRNEQTILTLDEILSAARAESSSDEKRLEPPRTAPRYDAYASLTQGLQ